AARAGESPEPVHQMRVAVRRLRSVMKVFAHGIGDARIAATDRTLKALGAKLAPARDWDVFVTGTAVPGAKTFRAEDRMRRLLLAADRRRSACNDALRDFLDSVEFRRLGVELACLAGSQPPAPDMQATDLATFAAEVLDGRLKKLSHIE